MVSCSSNTTLSWTRSWAGSLLHLAGSVFQIRLAFVWSPSSLLSFRLFRRARRWPLRKPWQPPNQPRAVGVSQLDNYSCFACCCVCYLRLTPLITVLGPTFIIVARFWITARMRLRHGISVSNLLQGATGRGFWRKPRHRNIILGSNKNIWLRLLVFIPTSLCLRAIVSPSARKMLLWCRDQQDWMSSKVHPSVVVIIFFFFFSFFFTKYAPSYVEKIL